MCDTLDVRLNAVYVNAANAARYAADGDAPMARHFARSAYSTAAEYGLFQIYREEIRTLERNGSIKRGCNYCREFYRSAHPLNVFAPRHTASSRCRSGHNNHCTCDTCF
jgi:hypothetical protein